MKSIRKPDLNAPRYRKQAEGTLNLDFIKLLRAKVPSVKELSDEQIKQIMLTFNENIWKTVIEERDGVEVPEYIGHIFIGTCAKKRSPNVDFKQAAELNQIIEHRNWESDQYLAKIFFTAHATKYRYRNHELWGFEPCRNFTRAVGRTYPLKWKQYVEIDPKVKISTLFRNKPVIIKDDSNKLEELIKMYNEFEL